MRVKCCRSTPRCRSCPARRIAEDQVLRSLGIPLEPAVPAHLRGIPRSLHKYEPLLKQAWLERGPAQY